MGRVNVSGQPTPSPSSPLTHFSHPHPLYPTPTHNPARAPPCSACNLQTQSPTYTCQICSFTLHQSCAQLPKLITHASHGGAGCTMALLTKPIYPGAVFSCDACADKGSAWSYHCERCSFDLHITCAVKPLKIRHRAHMSCELHLTFESPYAGSDEFSCDICQRISSKQWLYRCGSCGFDIHMDCNRAVVKNVRQLTHSASGGSVNYQPYHHHHLPPPHLLMHSASTGGAINYQQVQAQAQAPRPYDQVMPGVNHGGVVMGNQPYGPPPQVNQYGPNNNNNNLGGNLMMTAVDGLVNGVFQGIGQTMAQDIMGGGGGGGGGGDAGGGGGGGGDGGDGSGVDASAY